MNIDELHSIPEDEVKRRHNEAMQHREPHYNVFLDELRRRQMVLQGERMEALTSSINRLTWFIAGATIVGVILTATSLLL